MGKTVSKFTDSLGITDTGAGGRAMGQQGYYNAQANEQLKKMYEESKQRFDPYRKAGMTAFNQMVDMPADYENFSNVESPYRDHSGVFTMADFKQDPGYQFRMSEGTKAIERAKGIGGGRGSGGTMKALARYGQDYASGEYDKAYNRFNQDYGNQFSRFNYDRDNAYNRQLNKLSSIANYGYGADTTLAGYGAQTATGIANNMTGMGNAAANMELHRNDDMKGLWNMGSQLGGAAIRACWVARAIFGVNSPKWKEARHYILHIGPKWFRRFYLSRGEKISKVVEKSKFLKIILRPLFEYFAWRARLSGMEIHLGEFVCL